jgi:hypothetical protein
MYSSAVKPTTPLAKRTGKKQKRFSFLQESKSERPKSAKMSATLNATGI